MSVVGLSPSDLVNGLRAAKTILEAVKEEGGSKEKIVTALMSIEHDLEAIKNLEGVLDTVPDELSATTVDIRNRVRSLREFQENRRARLLKHKNALVSGTTFKAKAKSAYTQVVWPFSGEKDFQESCTRTAAALDATHLDAIMSGTITPHKTLC
ncbi:uncharacterized protein A1O5_12558 [Cladophialophora psammophila CBS 110553]|uniref:Uncharacterized protein n=1 Tax=Cladophialophora psammophila CBS 110553 TaxID=1182543 RepID=W9VVN8_9EURO|nr:uncharacterized protein A1O5_12558 [Cladophialophora psammophila CBS 110553]EXJ56291.1 hypothetical protein A1O5_12558 [Cladophialophora psammophila CBS 110553]